MKRTAYLHPQCAEELALLPAESRSSFYAQILFRCETGAKDFDVDFIYPHHEDFRRNLYSSYHRLPSAPEFITCIDSDSVRDGFIYLYLTKNPDSHHLLSLAKERRENLRANKDQAILFEDFLDTADQDEVRIARDIVFAQSTRKNNRLFLKKASIDAKDKTATVFNMSNRGFENFEYRINFYVEHLNELLGFYGAKLHFTVSYSDEEVLHFESLSDLRDISPDAP